MSPTQLYGIGGVSKSDSRIIILAGSFRTVGKSRNRPVSVCGRRKMERSWPCELLQMLESIGVNG